MLEFLGFDDNPIGSRGASALAARLRQLAGLKMLSSTPHPFTPLPSQVRQLPGLKMLSFTSCGIGDEGIAALVADLGKGHYTALASLWLEDNQVTDTGYFELAAAFRRRAMPKLEDFYAGESERAHQRRGEAGGA